jgi:putative endonuclease
VTSPSNRSAFGSDAEDQSAKYLLELGYVLITRRWKRSVGELDIVAMDGETIVFVEVKSSRMRNSRPEGALGDQKLHHLEMAAEAYVAEHELQNRPQRFDLITIAGSELRHYQDFLRDG